MAGDIHARTDLSHLSLYGGLDVGSQLSLAAGAVSLTSLGRVTLGSGSTLRLASGSTLVIDSAMVSWHTLTNNASLVSLAGSGFQVGFIFRASGLSLACRSANSVYYFNSDASGAA